MAITYQQVTTLTADQAVTAARLFEACHQADGTFSEPYLANTYNFDRQMPAFFMARDQTDLIGLLAVYADDQEAEISLMVDPAYRLQGVASQLYEAFEEVATAYGIEQIAFKSERIFLENHPLLMKRMGLEVESEEVLMGRDRSTSPFELRFDLQVELAQEEHAEVIARFQMKSFEEDYALCLNYARQTLANSDKRLYLLMQEGQVLASCSVDSGSSVNFLFGVAVDPSAQGQGLATYLMRYVINDLIQWNDKAFQLAVDGDNLPAWQLYQKLGFVELTRIVYLVSEWEEEGID